MSSHEDRARAAKAAQDESRKIERLQARIRLEEQYRDAQGEFLGNMAGGFGNLVGGPWMQGLIAVIKTCLLIGAGAVAAAGLYAAM